MKEEIIKLKQYLDSDNIKSFESGLENILKLNDPSCIIFLIELFDDDYEYDEVLFSVLHSIETFDDSNYSKGVIDSLSMLEGSPFWGNIIVTRILNNGDTWRVFEQLLSNSSQNDKEIFHRLKIG